MHTQYLLETDEQGNTVYVVNPEYELERNRKKYDVLLKMSNIPALYYNLEFTDLVPR